MVGYSPDLCRLQRSLVEDTRLDMGRTDDVDHAIVWFDAGSGQGCPLSPLDYVPMGEVRARMASKAYPGLHTPAGLRHDVARRLPGGRGRHRRGPARHGGCRGLGL